MKYTKAEVHFEHPAKGMDHCGDCRHFLGVSKCDIVAGYIEAKDWCMEFKRKTSLRNAARKAKLSA